MNILIGRHETTGIGVLGEESCDGWPGLIRFELAKAMSALETIVRVTSEKQTLILAGEVIPRRGLLNSKTDSATLDAGSRPLTIVATPVEEPMLLVQGTDWPAGSAPMALPRNPGPAANPVDAYVRTQALSSRRTRTPLVDIYA